MHILCERVERRRVLYRGFRSQVRSVPACGVLPPFDTLCRFERELEALRKELAETTARSGRSSPVSLGDAVTASDDEASSLANSPILVSEGLPLSTPSLSELGLDMGPVLEPGVKKDQ